MCRPLQLFVTIATLALLGCAGTPSQTQSTTVTLDQGDTKSAALEVCNPQGERAYLNRVRCYDGSLPTYRRVGSFGGRNDPPANLTKEQRALLLERVVSGAPLKPGEPDNHVVDGYELSCSATKRMVYLDMYHCNQEPPNVAPKGFILTKPSH